MALVLTLAQHFSTRRTVRITKVLRLSGFHDKIQVVHPNHVSSNRSSQSIWPQRLHNHCPVVARSTFRM